MSPEPQPPEPVERPEASSTETPAGPDAAVDEAQHDEPFDPHPDTPDDFDDDNPHRESVEAVPEEDD